MKISKFKTFKAALLGIVFIGTGIFLLVKNITNDYTIIGGLLLGGLGLLFVPNTVIGKLETFIIGHEIILFKDDQE